MFGSGGTCDRSGVPGTIGVVGVCLASSAALVQLEERYPPAVSKASLADLVCPLDQVASLNSNSMVAHHPSAVELDLDFPAGCWLSRSDWRRWRLNRNIWLRWFNWFIRCLIIKFIWCSDISYASDS